MKRTVRSSAALSIAALAALAVTACSGPSGDRADSESSPVYFGVSAAQTGQYAQYGEQFKQGFTLAVEQVNAHGGINGHPVELKYEDSQSDPKQSVAVAQKFVSDKSISLVFGDYSSAASIPASPIYTAGKLVQYGFNNSDPSFTAKGSEYQWSTAVTTAQTYTWLADYIHTSGVKSVAVTYLNTADWGVPAFAAFEAEAKKVGLTLTDAEAVNATSSDFRPALLKATKSKPQALVHVGYGPDGAEVVAQLRAIGFTGTFYGGQDVQAFNETPAAEGSIVGAAFLATSDKPEVKAFVTAFQAKYPKAGQVTSFEAGAYDALNVAVAAAKAGGTSRAGILDGFTKIKDVPSVVHGKVTFDQKTRRVGQVELTPTILKNQRWQAYAG